MKFIVPREPFAQAVKTVSRTADPQGQVVGTQGLVIQAQDNGTITVRSTNLMVQTTATTLADVTVPGAAVISAQILAELVQRLPSDTVTVEATPKGVLMKSGSSRTTLRTIETEPPVLQGTPTAHPITWATEGATWADIARRHLDMAAVDNLRPVLQGVLFHFQANHLSIVTTDGTRLALSQFVLPTSGGDAKAPDEREQAFVVPASAIREAAHYRGPATVAFGDHVTVWTFGDTTMVTRYLDGQYPAFDRVIPTEFATTIEVPTALVRGALTRMQIFSAKASLPMLTLAVTEASLTVSVQTPEVGSGQEDIAAQVDGEDLTMAFNPRYLLDALKPIQNERVTLQFAGRFAPVRITDPLDPTYQVIVLPLRTAEAAA